MYNMCYICENVNLFFLKLKCFDSANLLLISYLRCIAGLVLCFWKLIINNYNDLCHI